MFIPLTEVATNRDVHVSTDHITEFHAGEEGTQVVLRSGTTLIVKQTPEEIIQAGQFDLVHEGKVL